MNIKTAENINQDLVNLIKFYHHAGRDISQPVPVHASMKNLENLAYYIYSNNVDNVRWNWSRFSHYRDHFIGRVTDGFTIPVYLAAGVGAVQVLFTVYVPDE